MSEKEELDQITEKLNDLVTNDALKSKDIEYIKDETKDIKNSLDLLAKRVEEFYVNQDQFWPVKTMVYGLAGGILLTVLVAMMTLVTITHTSSGTQILPSPAPTVKNQGE